MTKNSDNPKNGAVFQKQVQDWFIDKYNLVYELEKKIAIGTPPKDHKFDIVCDEHKIAIECKRYTWTETGNVPSAKMGFTNEAAFYLSFLPDYYKKYIVMLYSTHPKRNETLAEYYYRTYKHLLGDIHILEYNPYTKNMREITSSLDKVRSQTDMTSFNSIHEFAFYYKNLFSNIEISDKELETTFADECFGLGFEMDCGESFIKEYGEAAFQNTEALRVVIDIVNDPMILGAAIFSKWRYITHWSYSSFLDEDVCTWFKLAFERLEVISLRQDI